MSKNELVPWSKAASNDVPDFLRGKERHTFESVNPERKYDIYRIAQALSDVVTENQVPQGNLYETIERVPLGTERHIVIFEKRLIRKKMNPKGVSVACSGWGLDPQTRKGGTGRIRMYNKDDIPTEDLEAWGIPLDAPAEGMIEKFCDECPFSSWRREDGKNIPPACNFVHEIFFLDIENGFDRVPKKIEIAETNSETRKSARVLDNLIQRNLRNKNLPDIAGVFLLKTKRVENAEGKKYFVFDFDFVGVISDETLYDAVEYCYSTFRDTRLKEDDDEKERSENENPWDEEVNEDIPWK